MRRVPELVIGLTLLAVPFEMMPQQSTPRSSTTEGETSLNSEDEAESYEIYSTVLKVMEPVVLKWTIVEETRPFQMCLEPARDQQSIYRPMIEDYAFKNKKTLVLQRKFKLSGYTLVSPEAWAKAQSVTRNPPRNPENRTFAVLSAVGFNRNRTQALLCFFANHTGSCYFTVKQVGKWQIDRSWRGGSCGWAY